MRRCWSRRRSPARSNPAAAGPGRRRPARGGWPRLREHGPRLGRTWTPRGGHPPPELASARRLSRRKTPSRRSRPDPSTSVGKRYCARWAWGAGWGRHRPACQKPASVSGAPAALVELRGLQPQTGPTASDTILTEETGRGQACSPPKGLWKTLHCLSPGEETTDGASGAVGPPRGPVGRLCMDRSGQLCVPAPWAPVRPKTGRHAPRLAALGGGHARLQGRDSHPALCPRCLRALLRSLAARGSVGIAVGRGREGCLRHRPALWLSPTRWRALPVGGPAAVCSWPPPLASDLGCSACPGVAVAPAPHTVSLGELSCGRD